MEVARAASILVVGDFARKVGITDAALRDLAPHARLLRTVLKSEALNLLSTTPFDLILAVSGPSLATAELMNAMSSLPIPIPILAVDHSPGPARAPSEGVEHLKAPVNVPELRQRIAALLAQRAQIVRIEGVSLSGFVQLVEMERRTCTLFVATSERRGVLGFSNGRLVDAHCAELDGEPAALEILGWPVTAFAYQCVHVTRPTTIRRSLTELLLDAARLGDESAHADDRALARADADTAFNEFDFREELLEPPANAPSPPPANAPSPPPASAPTPSANAPTPSPAAPTPPLALQPVLVAAAPPESDDYYDLLDRARELLRAADIDAAEALLLRALRLRPSDRVVEQNLRALARRRALQSHNH